MDCTIILPADVSDAFELTDLAWSAKRHWGYSDRCMESWRELLNITPAVISEMSVRKLVSPGTIAGFYALQLTGPRTASLEHFWVLPQFWRQGLGTALFRDAERVAIQLGATEFQILSDPNAELFYTRMGAKRIGSLAAPIEGEADRILPLMKRRLLPIGD